MATIKQIKDTNGNLHDILTMVGWGTCPTAAATAAKVATIEDTSWTLRVGSIVGIKYTNTNTAGSSTTPVTLNVNNTGAKNIVYAGSVYTSTSSSICGYASRTIYYMYDGTNWVWFNMGSLDGNSNTVPCIQIETAAATAAKVGTCTNYTLLENSYAHANVINSNTAQSALTLNVNGTGAKPIYINGEESSSSNYTLPAGTYIIYYDGTDYHFRTDGVLPGSILNATNADKLKLGYGGVFSGVKTFHICATPLKQSSGEYDDVYQIPKISYHTDDDIFTIDCQTDMNSLCNVYGDLYVEGTITVDTDLYTHGSITADSGFNGNLNGTATKAINDGGGNNISATYTLIADFDGFTEYVESDFVKKTGSLKNPNAIKFKNALGTVITYDGSSAADLSAGVYNATNATNANNVKVNTSTANSNLPILFTTTYPSTGTTETASNRAVYVDSEKNKFYYNPKSNQVTAAGGFFETSDERLKDIVNPITVDLDKLSKLRKVYFNWKDKPDSNLQLGMIAQDVQELYPELVSEADGQLSLSYEKLSVIALEAIDVLHNENNELKSRIERLESLVNQLAEKVND